MGDARVTRVTILGEEYAIGGQSSGADVPELAAYVDKRMKEIRRRSGAADAKRLAVLASLNIADELFRERALSAALLTEVRERAAKMDSVLAETLGRKTEGPAAP